MIEGKRNADQTRAEKGKGGAGGAEEQQYILRMICSYSLQLTVHNVIPKSPLTLGDFGVWLEFSRFFNISSPFRIHIGQTHVNSKSDFCHLGS